MTNIKDLFQIAADKKASDLHLVVGLPPALRIDGDLTYIQEKKSLAGKDMEQMVYSLLNEAQKEKFLRERELDIGFEIEHFRFRINLHFEKGNIGLVARVINDKMPTLEEIEMPNVIYKLLDLQQGLILLTGPTGCGKSTSLAAMVNYINENRFCNIITLEDPIEYLFKPKKSIIIQRQLGSDMVSFAEGLKHALRQDPNVIMVGEMRDLETIATTITLAETGHLVLATLHTYNASQTIDRIIDIFPPHQQSQVRMQLSTTLAGVISQRLLPKIDGGRVSSREIMINTVAIANLIREGKSAQLKTVIETSSKEGMVSIDQDLQRLYKEKQISKETAQAHMISPELLEKFKFL
ncbi:type IV pili twitching motility protein PilT [Candidatus Falkowbacteria bacterium RIFOXYB2_FULL_47_14]|uniref:Type IV pili twitching motility protein PilT n=1 Tax=Candidatus Falkowbacteria bacterium RIFOXYA2_FULL_47_19 TaxID=1797994 RepID=A0A1F5SN38_9BACT|nr:MAG: type IV pili twitching motility protein PilT [Candidatus Falkowbacteria bacterium RIFOXYA2_FULL_47_19]OGF36210.1 MAG: type IV pili twitching motility protein PilT [Candidatus Falkowbacteria bacterium RIFOXYC2_FULL_46_15]OGF42883.1 MAG: type IV pili twitching motility protein PilT [Candidatus Falkowbacteria bacterium RIFOXYB2_FULL_47_14]